MCAAVSLLKRNIGKMKKFGFIFCLFLFSCNNKNTEDYVVKTGSIINIESMKTISLGATDTIIVTFGGGTNGCASPDHLEVSILENMLSFKAYYKFPTTPRICTDNLPVHTLRHVFKPESKGTYVYKSTDTDVFTMTEVY